MRFRVSGVARLAAFGGVLLAAVGAWAQKGPVATVFTDDFADPATGWDVETDPAAGYRIEYAGGQYLISSPSQSQIILATNNAEFADGRMGVEAADLPLAPASPHGIFVRAQDPANFYGFAIVADGSFAAFHHLGGVYSTDAEGFLPPGLFRTDGPNLIEAVMAGGDVQYLVNGQPIATVAGVIWPSGVVGVFAINVSAQTAGTVFDNWRAEVVR